jgi:hypothetical protein
MNPEKKTDPLLKFKKPTNHLAKNSVYLKLKSSDNSKTRKIPKFKFSSIRDLDIKEFQERELELEIKNSLQQASARRVDDYTISMD